MNTQDQQGPRDLESDSCNLDFFQSRKPFVWEFHVPESNLRISHIPPPVSDGRKSLKGNFWALGIQ